VIGKGGRGTADHFGLPVDVLMGTFSKSLASQGGYICASKDVIDWIKHKARTFMFSAALAPASTAAALTALRILRRQPEMVDQLLTNARFLKNAFDSLGLNTMNTETSVVPVFVGDDRVALKICQQLLELGIFTTPVVYPAVPKGEAVIRCSLMATHSQTDLQKALEAFSRRRGAEHRVHRCRGTIHIQQPSDRPLHRRSLQARLRPHGVRRPASGPAWHARDAERD
jgi:7-keto-8-aminopelargonate synthetase-like enzyme